MYKKGASSWLTALPIRFDLHKAAFQDALFLRYRWTIKNCPSYCSCGQGFSIEYLLSCPTGGYPSIKHNEIRDITATLLSEVCDGVAVEPHL